MKAKDAVILVNLGSPETPTPKAVRRFLRQFLSDPRVVEIPRLLWWPILYGVILPFRPKRVARAYRAIWTAEGSPLKVFMAGLAQKLYASLQAVQGARAPAVAVAYSYGEPSIAAQIERLRAEGAERLLLLPLFPQYSATSTGPVYDQVAALYRECRDVPDIRIQKSYCQRQDYIAALVRSVQQHWREMGKSDLLLFSFHGIPQRNVDLGDPYAQQCRQTAADVAQALQLNDDQWRISFQSRLGKAQWLQPYTDVLLAELPGQGIARVSVICPAFSVDCLETLEEIDQENRQLFLAAGGSGYHYIPCLNDGEDQVFLLSNLVLENFA